MPALLDGLRERGYRPRTLEADRGYDTKARRTVDSHPFRSLWPIRFSRFDAVPTAFSVSG